MRRLFRTLLIPLAILASAVPALAANWTVKDSNGNVVTLCGFSPSTVVLPCHVFVDSSGAEKFVLSNPGMVSLTFGGAALTLGQKTAAASMPVALPSDQFGTPADAAWNGVTASPTLFAIWKGMYGQALQATAPGGTHTQMIGVEGQAGATPVGVDTVIRGTATSRSAILPVQESAAAVAAGGTGNVTGDVLTIVGGTSTAAAKCTATVTSGAVTACVPLAGNLGSYTALPSNPVATTSSGSGTGATLNLTWTGLAYQIAPANTARRGLHLQPQGGIAYLNGTTAATADQNSLKISDGALYETSPAFVGTGALSMITAGATPLPIYGREF